MYPTRTGINVFRLSRRTLLKAGPRVRRSEAFALQHIARHTSVPVPKILKYWPLPNGGCTMILEWFHEACTLEQRWKLIDDEARLKIAHQIRSFVEQIRCLPQPESIRGMVCAFDGSACWDERVKRQACGPFASERHFNDFRLGLLDCYTWEPGARRDIENIRSQLRDDHRIVLTHGDIGVRNILIDDHNNVVALIDWEMTGWMPEYWEYIKTVHGRWGKEDWLRLAREMVPPYDVEMEVDDQYIIINGGAPF
ncbi:kinase-like protein [Pluteus cervinus]|uniref:Kinase-like protein n=1 Tax=Pluteus cervinus TaxID=181527 RepID=A0ACD3B5R2_9AGAR|nr:kinase-like protein [Pluteus cervinus]